MSYVIAAYGVTGVTLVLYAVYLLRSRAQERRSLSRGTAPPSGNK